MPFLRHKLWFVLALAVRTVFFAVLIYVVVREDPSRVEADIFVRGTDTQHYHDVVDNLMNGQGYNSACRLPGFVPIYGTLHFIFGQDIAKNAITILQLLLGAFSVVWLGRVAGFLFRSNRVAKITFWLALFSPFIFLWDIYALSDSFANSLAIATVYLMCLHFFKERKPMKWLWLAAATLCWSIFFRPINFLLIVPLGLMILRYHKISWLTVKKALYLGSVLIISLSIWTLHNWKQFDKFIPLQDEISVCIPTTDALQIELRRFVIATGHDIQRWIPGLGNWFFESTAENEPLVLSEEWYTQDYGKSDIEQLRVAYKSWLQMEDGPERALLFETVVATVDTYVASLRQNKPFQYYAVSRYDLAVRLFSPNELYGFPTFAGLGPAKKRLLTNSLVFQLVAVFIIGLLGIVLALFRKVKLAALFATLPLIYFIVLVLIFGYVEQRYFVPFYIFCLPFVAGVCDTLWSGVLRLFARVKSTQR